MTNPIEDLLNQTQAGQREAARARLRVAVTEELQAFMASQNVTKAELAKRIGVSRSAVTQALSVSRNLSLNTLADMALALGLSPVIEFVPANGGDISGWLQPALWVDKSANVSISWTMPAEAGGTLEGLTLTPVLTDIAPTVVESLSI